MLLPRGKEERTMTKIREFGFPAAVLVGWLVASIYTVSALGSAHAEHHRFDRAPVAARSSPSA
jgi:hypothetical protein